MFAFSESLYKPASQPVTKHWCHPEISSVKITYEWTIDNFSLCPQDVGENLTSDKFGLDHNANRKYDWCLVLFPRGTSDERRDYIGLYLAQIASSYTEPKIEVKLSIINSKGKEANIFNNKTLQFEHYKEQQFLWGSKNFIRRDFLCDKSNGLLPSDSLTIFCEMVVPVSFVSRSGQILIPECSLSNDLERMFKMEKFTDVVLLVNERKFNAHKCMLSARSPVFAAMFEHKMKESSQSSVTIPDVEPTIFEEFLRFIYTSRVTNLRSIADSLLVVADKYGVDLLKDMCEESLIENLSCENAAELLILAYVYSSYQLKEKALLFININAVHVQGTAGWKTIEQSYPDLLAESFRYA